MVFATFFPYLQRQYSFSYADLNGAWRAHHDLLRVALSRGIVDQVHLFTSRTMRNGQFLRDASREAALRELRREFGEGQIQLKNAIELPVAARQNEYIFVEKAPALFRVAHARLAICRGAYPICTLVNSVVFPDLLQSFVGMLTAAEAYDALVVTSDAGLRAVKEGLEQADEFLRARSQSMPRNEISVVKIPLAIDESIFSSLDRACCRRILGIPKESMVLLYVGRFSDEYKADLEPLLLAFRELVQASPHLLLLLAGQDTDGRYSRHVEAFGDNLAVAARVKIVVNFPPTTKPVLYGAGDIFVSPVDNIEETFGLVVLEAMASGLPVVASDWSGYRGSLVDGETGFLVPTLWNEAAAEVLSWLAPTSEPPSAEAYLARRTVVDTVSLTRHLRALIDNEELRNRFGAAARQRVLQFFTWDRVIQQYQNLWREQIQIAKSHRTDDRLPFRLDFNRMFGHYATRQIRHSTAIKRSDKGTALATGWEEKVTVLYGAAFSREFVNEALRILEVCTEATTIQSLTDSGSRCAYEAAVWLLKKGFCELS